MKKWLFLFFFCMAAQLQAQEPFPFWNDVQNFKTQDSTAFPAPQQILFIGSSSFTKWQDVNDYFPGYHILNRGFGGSTLPDLMRYRYEVIFPYQPRQIVMYCGENDFAADQNLSVSKVVDRFKALFWQIRNRYPKVPFVYISMKPSPSREYLMPKFDAANRGIQNYLKTQKNALFVDVYHKMLQKNGKPMPEIFVGDNLHMNAKGYAIWKKLILPVLIK